MPTLSASPDSSAPPGARGPATPGPRPRDGVARALAMVALGPLVTGYAVVAALLALVVATAPGAPFGTLGVLSAAAPAWLAVYHVPVSLAGHQLGVLPLLPTALAMALVARSSANAARRLGVSSPKEAAPVVCVVAAAHATFATLLAVLSSHGPVSSSPVVACCAAGAFAALAAALGLARPAGLLPAALSHADNATRRGLRAGAMACAGLFGAGAVVVLLGLLLSWAQVVGLFRSGASGVGAGLGMVLLCVAYLPNAVVGGAAFATGPGFTIGSAVVAPWRFHAGPVPGLPLLAVVPSGHARWWSLLFALPAAVGALVGLYCRALPGGVAVRLRAVGVAALVTAVAGLLFAGLAGGALAGGPFDPVVVPAGLLAATTFAWVAGVGGLAACVGRWSSTVALLLPEPSPDPAEPAADLDAVDLDAADDVDTADVDTADLDTAEPEPAEEPWEDEESWEGTEEPDPEPEPDSVSTSDPGADPESAPEDAPEPEDD